MMEQQRHGGRDTGSPGTFGLGQLVLRCDRFTVSTVTLRAGLQLRPHAHARDQLVMVLAGQYQETGDTGAVTLRAGSVVWRRAGESHANVVGTHPVEVLLVELVPAAADTLCLSAVERAAYFAPGTVDGIRQGLAGELRRSDRASRVAIEAWVCLLAAGTGRTPPPPHARVPAWLLQAVALIRSGYPHRIRLSRLAAATGVHPVTVAAAFRRHFGQSVGEYVRDLRIAHARRALENTSRSIAAIALDAGFYDESHMGRAFRRRLGVAPGALRRGIQASRH